MKIHKSLVVIGIAGVIFLIFLSVINAFYRSKDDAGLIMAHDVAQLKEVFQKIHQDCGIIDFDAQKNPINFLNVMTFIGSEVGPMNLTYPEKWQGPYLKDNPTIYHITYQVVSTKQGYFITPGDGVTLPNKKVVGKDIVLDKKANITQMMKNPQELSYKDQPLAAHLDLGSFANVQFFLNEDDEEL
jgi:hypothetical protein